MSPRTRRIFQAICYESIAIAVVTPALGWMFDEPTTSALGLSVMMSTIALSWNYLFNWAFERWEARQTVRGRSLARRVAHGMGFEGGLTVMLVPLVAHWLNISYGEAFLTQLGLLLFFLSYTVAFTWVFDRVFGLPASAQPLPSV